MFKCNISPFRKLKKGKIIFLIKKHKQDILFSFMYICLSNTPAMEAPWKTSLLPLEQGWPFHYKIPSYEIQLSNLSTQCSMLLLYISRIASFFSEDSRSMSTANLNIPLGSTWSSSHGFDWVNKVEDSPVLALMTKRRSFRGRWGFIGF